MLSERQEPKFATGDNHLQYAAPGGGAGRATRDTRRLATRATATAPRAAARPGARAATDARSATARARDARPPRPRPRRPLPAPHASYAPPLQQHAHSVPAQYQGAFSHPYQLIQCTYVQPT